MAVTNHCTGPSFEIDTNADGTADNVANAGSSITGTPVLTTPAGRLGGKAQRIAYTGVAGDSAGKTLTYLACAKTAASFTAADKVTVSVFAKGTCTGTGVRLSIYYYTGADGYVSSEASVAEMTPSTAWQRFTFTGTVPATGEKVAVGLGSTFGTIVENDVFDVTFDDMVIESGEAASPYFDGDFAYSVWSGAQDASTSVFTSVDGGPWL
jgi:hypothetical protein